jgi:hypothetical protein
MIIIVRYLIECDQQSIAAKYDEILSYIHNKAEEIYNIMTLYNSIKDSIKNKRKSNKY